MDEDGRIFSESNDAFREYHAAEDGRICFESDACCVVLCVWGGKFEMERWDGVTRPDAGGNELLLDVLSGSTSLLYCVLEHNGDDDDLNGSDSGRQDKTHVVAMNHYHNTYGTGSATPAVLPGNLLLALLVLVLDLEHLAEVLPQVMRRRALRKMAADEVRRGGYAVGGQSTQGVIVDVSAPPVFVHVAKVNQHGYCGTVLERRLDEMMKTSNRCEVRPGCLSLSPG